MDEYDNEMGYYNVYEHGRDVTTFRVHGKRDITTFFRSISGMDGITTFFRSIGKGRLQQH